MLDNTYADGRGPCARGGRRSGSAAMVRITLTNHGDRPHRFSLRCEKPATGRHTTRPGSIRSAPADELLAGWLDRADRVLIWAGRRCSTPSPRDHALRMGWKLPPGETRTGWLVRPYRAYAADLPALRAQDWASTSSAAAEAEWRALLGRACRGHHPRSPACATASTPGWPTCSSCASRSPTATSPACPGTEVYRAPNSFEAGIMAVALDQVGPARRGRRGYRVPPGHAGAGRRLDRSQGLGAPDVGRLGLQVPGRRWSTTA